MGLSLRSKVEERALGYWSSDGSEQLDFAGSIETLGSVRNTAPGNQMHSAGFKGAGVVPPGVSAWKFDLHFDTSKAAEQSWSVGLSNAGNIKPSYAVKGYFMNERNLHDGSALLRSEYASDCKPDPTNHLHKSVDLQIDWDEKASEVTIYFITDGIPLGPSFRLKVADVPTDLIPTVVLGGGGQAATVQRLDSIRSPPDLVRINDCSLDPYEGTWNISEWPSTLDPVLNTMTTPLKLTAMVTDMEYRMARYKIWFKVVNQFSGTIECVRAEDGSLSLNECLPGPFMSTKMGAPPPLDKAEMEVATFFAALEGMKLSSGNSNGDKTLLLQNRQSQVAVAVRPPVDEFQPVTVNPLAPQ